MITRRERVDGAPAPEPGRPEAGRPEAARPAPKAPPPQQNPAPQTPLSVAELVARVKDFLEGAFRLPVLVQGEASNVRRPRGGHLYFTLKDRRAQLRVVVFSRDLPKLPFPVEEGAKVVVRGLVTAFVDAGELQLQADRVEPQGIGERAVRVEALRRKLLAEGLFDPRRKRPLPFLPLTIGLVTSPTGAAIRDVLTTIERRCPIVRVVLSPVRVSGAQAAPEVAVALRLLERTVACDAIIVARGGGSREDLEAFDEEPTCRAIAACRVPVITGIGHETDTSLADHVADVRAPTPTGAAELAVPDLGKLLLDLEGQERRLREALAGRVKLARKRLEACERSFGLRAPRERVLQGRRRLDEVEVRLARAVQARLERHRAQVAGAAGKLDSLSPLKVLARGFSLTTRAGTHEVVRDAATLAFADEIDVRLARGRVRARVLETHPEEER